MDVRNVTFKMQEVGNLNRQINDAKDIEDRQTAENDKNADCDVDANVIKIQSKLQNYTKKPLPEIIGNSLEKIEEGIDE